jgi:hypothetical protein
MRKLVAMISMTFGLTVGLGLYTQQARAKSVHYGTPMFAKGYWHTRGQASITYHIFKNHIWVRYSGWNWIGKHQVRPPWHGYDHTRFVYETKSAALACAEDRQTGTWFYLGIETISQNHIRLFTQKSLSRSTIYFYKPNNLYRGVR